MSEREVPLHVLETVTPGGIHVFEEQETCGHRCGSSGQFKCILPVGHSEADPPQPHHYRGG